MKEMVGGCCVCSDERGWTENPLVYCDGQGCNVAVHQACYGIVEVPTGPWFCRKCMSQERSARVRCELCPSKDGALKRTDSSGWAHVVCALYIPEVRFGNVTTMEPIILQLVPQERYNKVCYICEEQGKESKASVGACMQCNKAGCKQYFHVTCAQAAGLLCEEAGNYMDNVKYCGYCYYHYQKLKKVSSIKTIPAFKPIPADNATPEPSPEKCSPSRTEMKDKSRSRGERKIKHSVLTLGTKDSSNSCAPPLSSSEQGHQSDSSSSTSTLSSTNGSNSAEGFVDAKKSGNGHSTKNAISSKFTTANFKEILITPNGSPIFGTEKKKKKLESHAAVGSDKSSELPKCFSKPSSSALTFSGMYENFISGDIGIPSEKSQESKSESDGGKRLQNFPDVSEKKKAKHSRSKSKSSKGISDVCLSSECSVSNQIPIVRIKRNFPHDISSDSHSTLKINQNCSSVSQESLEKDHTYHWSVIEGPIKEEVLPPKEKKEVPVVPMEESEIISHMLPPSLADSVREENVSETMKDFEDITTCKTEEFSMSDAVHMSESFLKPIVNSEKHESKVTPDPSGLPPVPQTLEELLERQWEQGSNFLMEQAQHFDIASLLNCLNQLRSENQRLESHVKNLVTRRDHLLAVNARLQLPLSSIATYPNLVEEEKPAENQESATNGLAETAADNNNFMLFDHSLVHSTQENSFLKSPVAGHSPGATVGSSSLPLTPSPAPSSPAARNVNPLPQDLGQSSAVYQSISPPPPFCSPGTSASSSAANNTNLLFHQSYQSTPNDTDNRGEGDR